MYNPNLRIWISFDNPKSMQDKVFEEKLGKFIDMSIIWINVMSRVCPFGRPAGHPPILRGKNFSTGHYTHTSQPNFFIPAILL